MILVVYACCCLCGGEPGECWPGFRGAEASRPPADTLPLSWQPGQPVVGWRVPIPGRGVSEPVIWKRRVFVTSVSHRPTEGLWVSALALDTGEAIWERRFNADRPVRVGPDFANAAATPAVDLDQLYVLFEAGELLALSHDGALQWRRDLGRDYGRIRIEAGLAASVAQDEASVFVLVSHDDRSYLAALDKRSGRTRWKISRSEGASWSSPLVTTIDGIPQVVVSSVASIDGYDAQDGNALWSVKGVAGLLAPSPLRIDSNTILIGACLTGRGEALLDSLRSNGALRVARQDHRWEAHYTWRCDDANSAYASPIAHAGRAYWSDRQGVVYCHDVHTGRQLFQEPLAEACWATPLAVDGRIYFFGTRGTTFVIAAESRFRVLARNRLAAPLGPHETPEPLLPYASAAVRGNLLIRTSSELTCLRGPARATPPPP